MGKKTVTKTYVSLFLVVLIFILVSFSLINFLLLKPNPQSSDSLNKKPQPASKPPQTKNDSIPKIATDSGKNIKKITQNIPRIYGNQLRVPILMYHYIGNNPNPRDLARYSLSVSPDNFDKQMEYIASSGYTTTTFDTLVAALHKQTSLPAKPIILTFDDGYIDFYVNAFPILKKYNLHATSFIPTGLIGTSYYMSWPQIREIQSSGLISFEAHTVNHVNLTASNDQVLNYELTESKKTLSNQIGTPVNFMAYPYGITDARVETAVKKTGYIGSAGTWLGWIQSEGTIYDMPRVRVAGQITLDNFKKLF